jgi:hypothetical protein
VNCLYVVCEVVPLCVQRALATRARRVVRSDPPSAATASVKVRPSDDSELVISAKRLAEASARGAQAHSAPCAPLTHVSTLKRNTQGVAPWGLVSDIHFQERGLDRIEASLKWVWMDVSSCFFALPPSAPALCANSIHHLCVICGQMIETFKAQGVKHVFCLGDLLNTRQVVNVHSLSACMKFFNALCEAGFESVHVVLGNHDMHMKHSRAVSSLDALDIQPIGSKIKLYRELELVQIDGVCGLVRSFCRGSRVTQRVLVGWFGCRCLY